MAGQRVEGQVTAGTTGWQRFEAKARRLIELGAQGWRGYCGRLVKVLLTIAVVVAVLVLHWGVGTAFMCGLLAASVVMLVDGRVSVALGLLCLASWPVLLFADQHAWLQQSTLVNYYAASAGLYTLRTAPDTVATWAFYFLCAGLAGRAIAYAWRDKRYDSV